jgi:uncharacterized protein YchJ
MEVYTPKKGFAKNPLNRGDLRNLPCPCDSGDKIKKCCGRHIYLKQDHADMFNEWLKTKEGANVE